MAEREALDNVAIERTQTIELFLDLDALRDGRDAEALDHTGRERRQGIARVSTPSTIAERAKPSSETATSAA